MTSHSELIDIAAEAASLVDDYDGCFQGIREWEAQEEWEREAHPDEHPYMDYEQRQWWRARIAAALSAVGVVSDPTA